MFLGDFTDLSDRCRAFGGGGLKDFLEADVVESLGWTVDVVEQWLYDFSGWGPFLTDYGRLDLVEENTS